jgi:Arc/MetJ-type ribon-helix-helix transcriptional regulator
MFHGLPLVRERAGSWRSAPIPGIMRYLPLVVMCITFCHTAPVAKAISVRLDDEAERALRLLEATGLSRSDAIRSALLAAAERATGRRELAAEGAALGDDPDDRAEMLAVASLMESMRAAG